MGCFNVSCGISGISMYAADAVIIPLVPAKYAPKNLSGAMIVSNDGERVMFEPYTLPIFGSLDTYGRLEHIERDANVECIEKFFEEDINTFVNRIWNDGELSGMFVHREIWNALSTECISDYGISDWSIWDYGDLTLHVCELLGFIKGETDEKRERYQTIMTHPDYPEICLWSDGRWIRVEVNGQPNENHAYDVKSLVALMEKETGRDFTDDKKSELMNTAYWAVRFDEDVVDLKNAKKRHDSYLEMAKQLGERSEVAQNKFLFLDDFNSLMLGHRIDHNGRQRFLDIYSHRFDDIKTAFVALRIFSHNMFATNHIFMPSFNGYQYGNPYAERMLHQKALKIIESIVADSERQREKWAE